MIFDHYAFGLHISSEFELPELPRHVPRDAGAADVRIYAGSLDHGLPDVLREREGRNAGAYGATSVQFAQNATQMTVADVARFRVIDGKEIVVDVRGDASAEEVRMFLLGSALGVLCYQRNLVPLHATAIEFDGQAIAFTGMSGAGKSTLAAVFHELGYPVLCDDVCVLSKQNGRILAWPGHLQFKLTGEAVAHLGHKAEALAAVSTNYAKYHFANKNASSRALALRKIYALEYHDAPQESMIEPLSSLPALKTVTQNLYRPRLIDVMDKQSTVFPFAASVVDQADICIYRRTRGLDVLSREVALLADDFAREFT